VRILYCSPLALSPTLGASKALLELAAALRELGHECDLVAVTDLPAADGRPVNRPTLAAELRNHLSRVAREYDVVDFDHQFLPYERGKFPATTLMVARSQLLAQHILSASIPVKRGLRPMLGSVVKHRARRRDVAEMVAYARRTLFEADLVIVSNARARDDLLREGLEQRRVRVVPLGLSEDRRARLQAAARRTESAEPRVAFVGTFDPRKGAREMPTIIAHVRRAVPEAMFRLLGTCGMYRTRGDVLNAFPRSVRSAVEVSPHFDPDELPGLLAPCSVGFFPSHLEGFGLGVLEMLAASIPVIAYDVPGPPMMLLPEYLVPRGDVKGMAAKIVQLLVDERRRQEAGTWAFRRSGDFLWSSIARDTAAIYEVALRNLRSPHADRVQSAS
jgi:glycosyltransferase involved in cell wall biosynthesis